MTSREKVGSWPSWASPGKWVEILFEGALILSCNYIFTIYQHKDRNSIFKKYFNPFFSQSPLCFVELYSLLLFSNILGKVVNGFSLSQKLEKVMQ